MDLINPNFAYLLLVTGFLLAALALLSPGTGLLELGAFFALLLAGWQIYNLPINGWALLVLLLGIPPFIYAVYRRQSLALVAAIIAFIIGSAYIFKGSGWLPGVHPLLVVLVSIPTAWFLWLVARKTVESSAVRPVHDLNRLIGMPGEARSPILNEGSVLVDGELWSATSPTPIPDSAPVRVVAREGFLLHVEPLLPYPPDLPAGKTANPPA